MFTLISMYKLAPKKTGISLKQGPADSKCFNFFAYMVLLAITQFPLCNEWVWLFVDLHKC